MQARAELIFTGDELLRGDIVNTNQVFLCEGLLDLGMFATHAVTVTDEVDAIVWAIRSALTRHPDVIVISGGLGPTADDLTREAVAAALERKLVFDERLLDQIRARFAELGLAMGDSNRKQALLPQSSTAIPFSGTAPGFWLLEDDTIVVALPGVPRELKLMWTETVAPLLRARAARGQDDEARDGILVRRLRIYGLGESMLAELLQDIPWRGEEVDIGTRAGLDGLTLILRAEPTREAHMKLARIEEQVREVLGTKIYGTDSADLSAVVGDLLRDRKTHHSDCRILHGGLVAKRLTDIPGSSDYVLGGIVAYSNELKTKLLGVDPALIHDKGAVSEEVAAAMVEGARDRLGADCAIAVTGVAGPGGGTIEKPVGLVYVGTALREDVEVRRFTMFRSRDEIRERTAQTALDVFRRRLLDPLDR